MPDCASPNFFAPKNTPGELRFISNPNIYQIRLFYTMPAHARLTRSRRASTRARARSRRASTRARARSRLASHRKKRVSAILPRRSSAKRWRRPRRIARGGGLVDLDNMEGRAELDLSDVNLNLNREAMAKLTSASSETLTTLILKNTKICDADLSSLDMDKKWPNLRHLDITGGTYTTDGVAAILPNLLNLKLETFDYNESVTQSNYHKQLQQWCVAQKEINKIQDEKDAFAAEKEAVRTSAPLKNIADIGVGSSTNQQLADTYADGVDIRAAQRLPTEITNQTNIIIGPGVVTYCCNSGDRCIGHARVWCAQCGGLLKVKLITRQYVPNSLEISVTGERAAPPAIHAVLRMFLAKHNLSILSQHLFELGVETPTDLLDIETDDVAKMELSVPQLQKWRTMIIGLEEHDTRVL